jgi:hypothetical protein
MSRRYIPANVTRAFRGKQTRMSERLARKECLGSKRVGLEFPLYFFHKRVQTGEANFQ